MNNFYCCNTGAHIGTVVAMPLSGVLAQHLGWASVFYVFGKFSFILVYIVKHFKCIVALLEWSLFCHTLICEGKQNKLKSVLHKIKISAVVFVKSPLGS